MRGMILGSISKRILLEQSKSKSKSLLNVTTKSQIFLRQQEKQQCQYHHQHQHQQQRFQSSTAALWEEDADDSASMSSSTSELESLGQQRPRLEELRRQLEQENNGTSAVPPLITKTTSTTTTTAKTASTAKPSKKDEEEEENLMQLIQRLDQLPMPEQPLQDRFGRQHSYLRISLSEKCNLRCLYCMPEDGVPLQPQSHLLTNEEIVQLATWFVEQGVSKIRLTGGEPLLRKDLIPLVQQLNTMELEQIGMTTNGITLSKHLPDLVDAGLTHVNISLDSLDADKFARLTRRPPSYHARVLQAIEDCAHYLPHRTKINCVLLPDNADEMEAFCELTKDMPIDVRFIEYMPFNENQWKTNEFVSYAQMQERLGDRLVRLVDGPNDTTKWWGLVDNNNGADGNGVTDPLLQSNPSAAAAATTTTSMGRIGFITSMSEHFCGTCNRLRITADGQLKVCLFGKTEVSLRDLLRMKNNDNDDDVPASQQTLQTMRITSENGNDKEIDSHEILTKVIHHAVQNKHFKLGGHSDMEDLQAHSDENRPMTLIGG